MRSTLIDEGVSFEAKISCNQNDGDSAETVFEMVDINKGGTCMKVAVNGEETLAVGSLKITMQGSLERSAFLKALKFADIEITRVTRQGFTFSQALELMKDGASVTRLGWNGNGMFILMQFPDENSKMTRPYIYIVCPRGSTKQFGETTKENECVPWLCSQTDLMAEDWVEIV